jgi:hypothetical protein
MHGKYKGAQQCPLMGVVVLGAKERKRCSNDDAENKK